MKRVILWCLLIVALSACSRNDKKEEKCKRCTEEQSEHN